MRDFVGCAVDAPGQTTYSQIWRIKECEFNNQGLEAKFGYFTYGQACAVQPSIIDSVVRSTGSRQCVQGCEYVNQNNEDRTSTATPNGSTCATPAFDQNKNNQCHVVARSESRAIFGHSHIEGAKTIINQGTVP